MNRLIQPFCASFAQVSFTPVTIASRISSAVNLAAMAHAVHAHNPDFIGDLINHPIVAHTDAPVVLGAGEFATTGRARVVGESANGGDDPVVNFGRKPFEVFLGSAFEEDPIHGQ